MREVIFSVDDNKEIARDIYRLTISGDTSDISAPGQFVNVKLPGHYLRRPFSVCDWDADSLTIIYKVIGSGTNELSRISRGEKLSALISLGNGYDITESPKDFVIVGGGVGIPPLYGLAKRLVASGKYPNVILGFNSVDDCFYIDEFRNLGLNVKVTTVDGSYGIKGYVTDAFNGEKYAYACGPLPMLKAVHDIVLDGQFSFEARMACGFGACLGCSIITASGYKRVCKDGPVFKHSEILWENDND